MCRSIRISIVTLVATTMLVACVAAARAQSGTRTPYRRPTTRTELPRKSTPPAALEAPLALGGYCPVCIIEIPKWNKGNPAFQTVYDGHTYYFPNEQHKEMFLADPAKYLPAFGGDCVVTYAESGVRKPGSIRHSAYHQGRLFLFANEAAKKLFLNARKVYQDVDLALGGECPVCRINMGKKVPGKPEFQATFEGFRYFFPSTEQRDTFLADPQKYKVNAKGKKTPEAGSGTK